MLRKESASDRAIAQKVTQALTHHGLRAPCAIQVASRGGNITLSGTIEYVFQHKNAVQAAAAIPGVHRVIDQLAVKHRDTWADQSSAPPPHPN